MVPTSRALPTLLRYPFLCAQHFADPTKDDYFDYWNWRLDSSKPESEQKKTVWTNIVYNALDQLCQRTAWALSQIFQTTGLSFDSSLAACRI